jgi:hypothetical protein
MVGATFSVAAAVTILRSKKSIAAISVEVDTAQSQFGGSSLGIGSGYLRIADHSSLSFGTNDFTIEFWFRPSVLDATDIVWDQRPNGIQGLQPTIYTSNGQLFYYTNAGNRITGPNLSTGIWQHIAVSRSGTSTRMFINGTQTGSTYTDTNNYVSSSQGVWIGADQYFSGNNSVGWIDEIRISNSARYTTTFTPSTTPFVNDANTVVLIHANGTDASTFFEDDNGVRAQEGITAAGNAQIDTAQSRFGGSSALFDGTGDWLQTGLTNRFGFGTGDFTLEGWFRFNSLASDVSLIAASVGSGDAGGFANATATISSKFSWSNGAAWLSTTTTLATNTWYHFAATRQSGTLRLFVNGVLEHTSTQTISISTASRIVYIGGPAAMNGWADEVRISNIARYTASFTAPTEPFVNDSNTLLLVHADGTDASTVFRDDNGAVANRQPKYITAVGNAQIDTAQSQFSGSSALFDGTTDYLLVGADPTMALGSGDWTIEMWIRFASTTAMVFYDHRPQSTDGAYPALYWSSSTIRFYVNSADRITSSSLSTNTWYHLSVVKSSGSTRMYINGTQSGSTYTDSITYLNGASGQNRPIIGAAGDTSGGAGFNGHIDELRVSNIARYTANFTSPSAPFVNDANTLLLIHADGTDATTQFFDDAGNRTQKGIRAIGNAQISTAQAQFGNSSYLGDGTGDYLIIPTSPDLQFTLTESWTVEFWARPTTVSRGRILFQAYDSNSPFTGWGVQISGGDDAWAFWDGVAWKIFNSQIVANTWYHIAIVSTAGSVRMYQNGVQQSVTFNATTSITHTTSNLAIGAQRDGTSSFPGHIDEIRISNSARYSANFTPSTTPFQNDANTMLLMHMDGTNSSTVFIDDNGIAPYTL